MTEDIKQVIPWKWVTSVAGIIITVVIGYAVAVGTDVQVNSQANQTQQQELARLSNEIAALRGEIKARTDGRYTAAEATRDLAYVERRLAQIERSIETHMTRAEAHHKPPGGQ